MKPCDCKDSVDVDALETQGISFNEDSILVQPNSVILTIGNCQLKIYMKLFEKFARWYIEDQNNQTI